MTTSTYTLQIIRNMPGTPEIITTSTAWSEIRTAESVLIEQMTNEGWGIIGQRPGNHETLMFRDGVRAQILLTATAA